ncbi:MAG: thioredoxin-disulfide reductase [Fusobacteria bacterium]|nr:thioredoxin-disulfide reductase [Fusobacteriota bacterium]
MVDLCIIGGGPAGMTAALYGLRGGLSVNLIEQGMPGGQLLKTERIDNYPGFSDGVLGSDLALSMYDQVSKFDEFSLVNAEAKSFKKEGSTFIIEAGSKSIEAKALILATGGNPRNLNVPGEVEYAGRGVSYCAICDGFFFKDKTVAVIGGGNTALEDAIYLTSIAKEVYLIHRRNEFRGSQILVDELKDYANLHVMLEKVPVSISGDTKVNQLIIKDTNSLEETSLFIDGVFVAVGQIMNSGIVKNFVSVDDSGSVQVDEKMETSLPGLFACGDIVSKTLKQVSTAVGDGALAGQMAYEFIRKQSKA